MNEYIYFQVERAARTFGVQPLLNGMKRSGKRWQLAFLLGCVLGALATAVPAGAQQDKLQEQQVLPQAVPLSDRGYEPPEASGQEAAGGAPVHEDGRPALQRRDNSRYKLCASDVIALTFPQTPEFNQTVNVQPDGYVSLSGVGDVHLEGLTSQESIAVIKTAYEPILHDPLITLELKDFNKPYFIVGGHVFKPGKFDLRGETTATQAVAMAGGFMESAKHSQVLLFRRVNDSWLEVKPLDLKHILQGHDVDEDPEIRSGDMLYVPQNFISKVKKFIPNYGIGSYYDFKP
jgi:polysaccharide biosynthesis/export protein